MDPDLSLVTGLALGVLAVPSIVSSLSDGRAPRVAAITLVIAGGLIVYAIDAREGGYDLHEIPDVVYGVISRLL